MIRFIRDEEGLLTVETNLTDYALLNHSLLNKGMAFSEKERDLFSLHGLLPPEIATIQDQRVRSYNALQSKNTVLGKYNYLRDLQDSNETLFFYLLTHSLEELMPVIYTPGVGEGCIFYSHIYRRPRGIFLSPLYHNRMEQILSNKRFQETEVIVVSDGERILGLGDQGAGGMGIPIGKLCLYTACAGIHPKGTLPIFLDTGTDNEERLNDPLYIGWRHQRLRGQEYNDFIDQFVQCVKKQFPHVLLQWEDFAQQNAGPILEKYRDQLCTFNDDIQGTAAVAVGTLLAAIKVAKSSLKEQRIVVVGAGSAGCGISNLLLKAMIENGLAEEEAKSRFFLVDRTGLLTDATTGLFPFQKPFAQAKEKVAHWNLEQPDKINLKDVVRNVHPTLLIGVSGQMGIFTEEIVREMAAHTPRPIIFPLSNPTQRSEATPSDLLHWTQGTVIMGTGSPFGTLQKDGKSFRVDQTNNCYIFPGMGLGLISVKAKRVTDAMFMKAAITLADCSPSLLDLTANLLPPISSIREVSYKVAVAVAKEAVESGLSDCPMEEIEHRIRLNMWTPAYPTYHKQ